MNLSGALSGIRKKVQCPSRHDSILLFGEATRRMLDIGNWHVISGEGSAVFVLCDHNGEPHRKSAAEDGDLVRIELQQLEKPHAALWMRVEKIIREKQLIKDEEIMILQLRTLHSATRSEE